MENFLISNKKLLNIISPFISYQEKGIDVLAIFFENISPLQFFIGKFQSYPKTLSIPKPITGMKRLRLETLSL